MTHHVATTYIPARTEPTFAGLWLRDAAAGLCLVALLASAYFVI